MKENVEIEEEEEKKPGKTYFVLNAGCLRMKLDRERLDTIEKKLVKLRDNPKPKKSPQAHADEIIIKAISFNKPKAVQYAGALASIKNPPLRETVLSMRSRLFDELEFDPEDKSQTKLKEKDDE